MGSDISAEAIQQGLTTRLIGSNLIYYPTVSSTQDIAREAAVEGALELNKEKIFHAVMLDPNTASVCSPQEIRDMVNEMFEKEAKWIPQF